MLLNLDVTEMRVASTPNGTEFWMSPEEYEVMKLLIKSVYSGDTLNSVSQLDLLNEIQEAIDEAENWNKNAYWK